jgi:PAS domain S-box-containing protein
VESRLSQMDGVELGAFADALDIGLIVLDRERRVAGWNAWLASSSGIRVDAAIGRTLEEVFEGQFLRRLNSAIGEALESGASSLLTHALHPKLFPLKTRSDQPLVHDVFIRPIGAKPYSGCVVQISDVTLSTQRERVLRDRLNARYAAVVDSAQDAILTIDAEGIIQLANAAAGREFGGSHTDLVGRPICDLLEDRTAWRRLWRAVLGGEIMQRPVEFVSRREDGSASYLEVSASRWLSDSRTFVSVILRDANERHATEAKLRRLNETLEERVATTLAERQLLADIVEDTDALVLALDRDFRIVAVNRAWTLEFERFHGKTAEIGDDLLDLLAAFPKEQTTARAIWKRALAGEAFTEVQELGGAGRDQRFYELKFNALRDPAGSQFAAFQFAYDITERIQHQAQLARTEEALRQSQKMEAIGQLTGGIAHDFNNLLTGIIGSMDILKRRLAAGRYDEVQRFMDAATTSASRAAALTHRLLAFSRRQPLDPKGVDPNALVNGIEDLLRRTLGEQVRLTTDLAPDAWHVLSDSNQLENALLNLAINARDAMPDGGRLTVTTRNLHSDAPVMEGEDQIAEGDYAVITVSDTGVGMAPEIIPRVFDPFFTTKPLGEGTGLGLSMIYGFARQSRGHVRIESAVGQGTAVQLYLPRYRGELEQEESNQPRDLPTGAGETVLLVEDDSSVRLLIGEVLRELGYSCVEAIDGKAALSVLTSNTRLDLMISDIGLPGLSGQQLAATARQHRPDLKILFVTGYAHHAAGAEQLLGPGMAMVTKPFSLDALALKIRDMLSVTRA